MTLRAELERTAVQRSSRAMEGTRPTIAIIARQEDAVYRDKLLTQLGILVREGYLDVWHDGLIGAGKERGSELQRAIGSASAAVVLLSASLIGSSILDEILPLLGRAKESRFRLFPLLTRPCDWKSVPWLRDLEIRPRHPHALSEAQDAAIDAELCSLVEEIREALAPHPPMSMKRNQLTARRSTLRIDQPESGMRAGTDFGIT